MSALLSFFVGLVVLVAGAELVVRGAARLALALGMRPLILGITVVAIGTSTPELAVGLTAGLQGNGALAVGNIVGANLYNILFILGLSALLKPLVLHRHTLRFELPVMVGAAAVLVALGIDGSLSRTDGGIFLGLAVVYTGLLVHAGRRDARSVRDFRDTYAPESAEEIRKGKRAAWKARLGYAAMLVAGLGLTILGANWMVDGAVSIARALGISESVIGLTIVTFGTSAPELVTTLIATLRNERDIAVGNLLGSSIYNILVILGLTCLVSAEALPMERALLRVDIPFLMIVTLACTPIFLTGQRISRGEGALGVSLYAGFLLYLLFLRG